MSIGNSGSTGSGGRERRLRLSVNVDHVATVRQARQVAYPSPLEAALLAEAAGADGITVHLRQDRRHIQETDVTEIRREIRGRLNLELAASDEMLRLALELRPHKVTLVPERPEEVTTEGGLDVRGQRERIEAVSRALHDGGIEVALFVDPVAEQIDAMAGLEEVVPGFEINTDAYTRASAAGERAELEKVRAISRLGSERGLRIYAGHGLTTGNVAAIAAIPEVEELNIGHALVGRALMVGMTEAVREYRRAMGLERA